MNWRTLYSKLVDLDQDNQKKADKYWQTKLYKIGIHRCSPQYRLPIQHSTSLNSVNSLQNRSHLSCPNQLVLTMAWRTSLLKSRFAAGQKSVSRPGNTGEQIPKAFIIALWVCIYFGLLSQVFRCINTTWNYDRPHRRTAKWAVEHEINKGIHG